MSRFYKKLLRLLVIAVFAAVLVIIYFFIRPVSSPLAFSSLSFSEARALDLRSEDPATRDLTDEQLEALKDYLLSLKIGRKDSDLNGLTPLYSLTVYTQEVGTFVLAGYGDDYIITALVYDNDYYRINDENFADFLSKLCSKDTGSSDTHSFTAVILDISNGAMLVNLVDSENKPDSSSLFWIPIQNISPSPEPKVSDLIEVQYAEEVAEGTPAFLTEIAFVKIIRHVSEDAQVQDLIPMVKAADGKLYLDTGYKSAMDYRPSTTIHTINSEVDGSGMPTETNQSNFGTGYRYQFVNDETIEVEINGAWWVYATESVRQDPGFWETLRLNYSSSQVNSVLSSTMSSGSDPLSTVQLAIEGLSQMEYTITVRVDEISVDEKETSRMIESYKGSELAVSRGWTDEYLAEAFVAVRAKYFVEYDHTKTFLGDGNIDQYVYLTRNLETGFWAIVDYSTNGQPASNSN